MNQVTKIKVYGERNTGTNYFCELFSANFDVDLLRSIVPNKLKSSQWEFGMDLYFQLTEHQNLGWKHRQVNISAISKYKHLKNCGFITLTKNPYSFLLSLYKKPYHQVGDKSGSFTEFLKTPWPTQRRDGLGSKTLKTPIELWNIKKRSYIDLKNAFPAKTCLLKYEELVADPEACLRKAASLLSLPPPVTFKNVTRSTKNTSQTFSDYQKYYLNEEWKNKLCQEDLELINESLDKQVAGHFGYSVISKLD